MKETFTAREMHFIHALLRAMDHGFDADRRLDDMMFKLRQAQRACTDDSCFNELMEMHNQISDMDGRLREMLTGLNAIASRTYGRDSE